MGTLHIWTSRVTWQLCFIFSNHTVCCHFMKIELNKSNEWMNEWVTNEQVFKVHIYIKFYKCECKQIKFPVAWLYLIHDINLPNLEAVAISLKRTQKGNQMELYFRNGIVSNICLKTRLIPTIKNKNTVSYHKSVNHVVLIRKIMQRARLTMMYSRTWSSFFISNFQP